MPIQEIWVQSLGREDALEKEMATNSSFLSRKSSRQRYLDCYSPWDHRVKHNWATAYTCLNTYICTKMWTYMTTAALLITAKAPRCPSIGEWINKLWCIQTIEYYWLLWRHLQYILLHERYKSEKATCCMIPTIWNSEKLKQGDSIKFSDCCGLGEWEWLIGRAQKNFLGQWNYSAGYYNGKYESMFPNP